MGAAFRDETIMMTRCPHCRTAFRVTREQLLARDGKVRCGACRRAFNAMGYLHKLPQETEEVASPPQMPPVAAYDAPPKEPPVLETRLLPEEDSASAEDDFFAGWPPAPPETNAAPAVKLAAAPDPVIAAQHASTIIAARQSATHPSLAPDARAPEPIDALLASIRHSSDPIDALLAQKDVLEDDSLLEDEEADIASSSRWSDAQAEVSAEAVYPQWPFVLAFLLFGFLLLFQVVYHYRSELGRQAPAFLRIFSAFNVSMPLAQEIEWLSIDASELSPAANPGHFQLAATLRNQSRYPQAWPQLEISLTDSYDNILTRRVFPPAEYLPADTSPAFAPGDTSLRLYLDAGDLNPTGYRLYLFYF
jgi:predicted Zn finger-like uncharacterized protein